MLIVGEIDKFFGRPTLQKLAMRVETPNGVN